MSQIETTMDVEYRGAAELGGDFENEKNETVAFGLAHRFDYESEAGLTKQFTLRESAFKEVTPPVVFAELVKGEMYVMTVEIKFRAEKLGGDGAQARVLRFDRPNGRPTAKPGKEPALVTS